MVEDTSDIALLIFYILSDSNIILPSENVGAFHNVGYAYEDSSGLTNQKDIKAESEESRFTPPFVVPDNLIHNLVSNDSMILVIKLVLVIVKYILSLVANIDTLSGMEKL